MEFIRTSLDHGFISVPILFFLFKYTKIQIISKTALEILRWIIVFLTLVYLYNWLIILIEILFGKFDQIAFIQENLTFYKRAFGSYFYIYWLMIICNILPIILIFNKFGKSFLGVFLVGFIFKFGLYMERWIIIMTSLHFDFLSSHWTFDNYSHEFTWLFSALFFTICLLIIAFIIDKIKIYTKMILT